MIRLRRRQTYMAVKNPVPRRLVKLLIVLLVIFLLIRTFFALEARLRPAIFAIAEARATVLATETINRAIYQNVAQGSRYENLVFIQKDREGNVASVEINNLELARIQALTTTNVQLALKTLEEQEMKVPLGQILGSEIFASWGPRIKVAFIPVGTVSAQMQQEFESGGINVISHQVGLDITVTMQIVVPFMKKEIKVNTYTPLVTATFFGKVPETVINLPPIDFQFPSAPGDK